MEAQRYGKIKKIPHNGTFARRQKNRVAPKASEGKIEAAAPARLRPETGGGTFCARRPTPIISAQEIA